MSRRVVVVALTVPQAKALRDVASQGIDEWVAKDENAEASNYPPEHGQRVIRTALRGWVALSKAIIEEAHGGT